MTKMQRFSYWSGFLYYVSTALDVFVLAVPPILLGVFAPAQVQVRNYIFVLWRWWCASPWCRSSRWDATAWSA